MSSGDASGVDVASTEAYAQMPAAVLQAVGDPSVVADASGYTADDGTSLDDLYSDPFQALLQAAGGSDGTTGDVSAASDAYAGTAAIGTDPSMGLNALLGMGNTLDAALGTNGSSAATDPTATDVLTASGATNGDEGPDGTAAGEQYGDVAALADVLEQLGMGVDGADAAVDGEAGHAGADAGAGAYDGSYGDAAADDGAYNASGYDASTYDASAYDACAYDASGYDASAYDGAYEGAALDAYDATYDVGPYDAGLAGGLYGEYEADNGPVFEDIVSEQLLDIQQSMDASNSW